MTKYSPVTNTWEVIGDMHDDRSRFCACSFMDNVYLIGGPILWENSSCIEFNTKNLTWKEVAGMNEPRKHPSCAVFEGRIVTSGGFRFERLNTVEMYDHLADSWSYMPNMIETRYRHKSVAIKNKLFVVGGITSSCEVFDSNSNKFVLLKQHLTFVNFVGNAGCVTSVGSKLVVFSEQAVLFYDVKNHKWSQKILDEAINQSIHDYFQEFFSPN